MEDVYFVGLLKGIWSSIYRNTEYFFEVYCTRNQSLPAQIDTLFPAISADTNFYFVILV